MSATGVLTRQEAEDFLYREALLLDDFLLNDWLELFTADCLYWLPANEYYIDPLRKPSMLYDNRERLENRVWRLTHGPAHSQIPQSRTRRIISNVQIGSDEGEDAVVYSNFVLYEARKDGQRAFAGRYEHRLRREDGAWKIARKTAYILNNDQPIYNLTIMV